SRDSPRLRMGSARARESRTLLFSVCLARRAFDGRLPRSRTAAHRADRCQARRPRQPHQHGARRCLRAALQGAGLRHDQALPRPVRHAQPEHGYRRPAWLRSALRLRDLFRRRQRDPAQVRGAGRETRARHFRAQGARCSARDGRAQNELQGERHRGGRAVQGPAWGPDRTPNPRGNEGTMSGRGREIAILELHGRALYDIAQVSGPPSTQLEAHLAVPLIGLGEVIGVLFVRRAEGVYVTRHLQALSVVAAQIAAYLTMLRAVAADAPNRAKHELLDLMYGELRPPLAAALAALRILGSKALPEADRARRVAGIERSIAPQTRPIGTLLPVSG